MKVLVVDDEPLARQALAKLLARRPDVEHFDTAEGGEGALSKFKAQPYDVLLLDIQMPGLSGIEFIERLSKLNGVKPSVIFVTAHEEYAVKAFERHAIDYVLKPFVASRVHDALDLAARRSAQERAERLMHALDELKIRAPQASTIAIKDKDRVVFVDAAVLISAEADGNYVVLKEKSASYLLRGTIAGVAEVLEPCGFLRIHRSVLVNAAYVATVQPGVGNDYILCMKTGDEYRVSNTYRHNLKALAQYWIGSKPLPQQKRRSPKSSKAPA